MNKHIKALEQAQYAYESKEFADREVKVNRAVELSQWGFFTCTQISDFTGLSKKEVKAFTVILDEIGMGGKMHGGSIKHILAVIHLRESGFTDDFATQKALDAGCSSRVLARFTEMSQSMVALQSLRASR